MAERPTHLHEAIAAQALRTPQAEAVRAGSESLSYRGLDERSTAVARDLAARGVSPDSRVALFATRTPETVIGLLGILKAGAAYVPLDRGYPAELLAFMLSDCGAGVALASRKTTLVLPAESKIVRLWIEGQTDGSGEDPKVPSNENLAYFIYTSGSTGRPKGVLVTHGNLAHSTGARRTFYRESPRRFLLLSSFASDSSVAGIFWTLSSGGTLVLPVRGEERDPQALADLIDAEAITHTLCLPSIQALASRRRRFAVTGGRHRRGKGLSDYTASTARCAASQLSAFQ